MPNIEVKLRRGTTSQHSSFAGAQGEVTVDTDLNTLMVHTGGAAGSGVRLAKHSELSGAGGGGTVTSVGSGTGLTGGPITTSGTLSIGDNGVTFAKMQDISTAKVIGRTTAGSGDPEEVSILDEDDMASNSATALATQQSIKAYVDSQASSSLSVAAWTQGSITSATELQAPDNSKSFAGIYVRSNLCGWSEIATVNYYTDATTTEQTFYINGAGDSPGSVATSSLLLVPLYTNTSGNKVVKISWSNMAVINGRYWI